MRAIWSGSLSFGLVNIPVKLYSATSEPGLTFDLLHKSDFSRIRYSRICISEEKEVPYDEIIKGFEYSKGNYVTLEKEDFERANIRVTHAIIILDFVRQEEIDPIYLEKPYFLEPDAGSERAYALLRDALKRAKKVGVGKFVLRNREHLIQLRTEKDGLILEQMRFKSDIRDMGELHLPGDQKADEREIKMALALIDQLSRPFDPNEYKDTYTSELRRVIEEKVSGKVPSAKGEAPVPTRVPDLMEMLKRSLNEKERTRT